MNIVLVSVKYNWFQLYNGLKKKSTLGVSDFALKINFQNKSNRMQWAEDLSYKTLDKKIFRKKKKPIYESQRSEW